MIMAKAKANEIQIEFETYGDRSGRPLLLIMGLGGQMIGWSKEVINQLVDEGLFVIIFENWETELSRKIEEAVVTDVSGTLNALMGGENIRVPYTCCDMGDDAVGLLDVLGIGKAHVCGMSMGGSIAATIAINHPSSLVSLILIYAPTGNPNFSQPEPESRGLLMTTPVSGLNAYGEQKINAFRLTSGSGFSLDEEWVPQVSLGQDDRSYYPVGLGRTLLAGSGRGNRRSALPSITAPTLMIYVDEDPLVPLENGLDVAEAIPGAELMIIRGQGHYPPRGGPWPGIIEAISKFTEKVANSL
jgi:pimeloyl-ACP methyl ester carboxylesterase